MATDAVIPSDRLKAALAAIDQANADDPHTIEVDGQARPKEQAHAELMTEWSLRSRICFFSRYRTNKARAPP